MAVELKHIHSDTNNQYLTRAYNDIILQATGIPQNIIDNYYNVKFICNIVINNENAATLKAPPKDNKAIFRVSSVLQDFTVTDNKGYDVDGVYSTYEGLNMSADNHSIHQIDKFARNRSNLRYAVFLGGYEYSTTPSGTIQQSFSIEGVANFLYTNSVIQHDVRFNQFNFDSYLLNSNTDKFLSVFPNSFAYGSEIKGLQIQLGQYHTLAFFNGKHYQDSKVTRLRIQTFDDSNTLLNTYYTDNTSDNGGAEYGQQIMVNAFNGFDNTNEGLLYFGCGTQNLQDYVDFNNVSFYVIKALNVNADISNAYRFDIQRADCKGYETIRLAFLNSLGAWDYYNFTKKSTRKTQINKSPIKSNYGYQGYAKVGTMDYNQGTYNGGTRAYNVNAIETIEANTSFIREDEAAILEELFTSVDVYMQDGDNFVPVVINEAEYLKQTSVNDKLIQYIITIEKGHNTRVQRL